VLACVEFHGRGSKHNKYAPGVVTDYVMAPGGRPYEVTLDKKSDGLRIWYFGTLHVVDDNRRNRRNRIVI
jgi:hypothetical protein